MMIAIYFEAKGNYGSGLMHASLGKEYVHVFSITFIKSCSIPQNTAFEIGIQESTAKDIPIGIIRLLQYNTKVHRDRNDVLLKANGDHCHVIEAEKKSVFSISNEVILSEFNKKKRFRNVKLHQAMYRNIQEFGLSSAYCNDEDIRMTCRKLMALTLLPPVFVLKYSLHS
jgi:hypothetical protein